MQMAVSNPVLVANVQGAFAAQVSMASELNLRPFFRRRLMLKDGRVDYFEVAQLSRYLKDVPNRSEEQETQLKIVMWIQDFRQSLVPGSTGDLMMGQICNDPTLPQLFVPVPSSGVQSSMLDKIWNEAKATLPKKRSVPIIFEEAAPLPVVQQETQSADPAQPPMRPMTKPQAKIPLRHPQVQPQAKAQGQVLGQAQPNTPARPVPQQQGATQPTPQSQSPQTPLQKQLKQITTRPQAPQAPQAPQSKLSRPLPNLTNAGDVIPRAVAPKVIEDSVNKKPSLPNQVQPPVKSIHEQVTTEEQKNGLIIKARESLARRGVTNITPTLVFAEMQRLSANP